MDSQQTNPRTLNMLGVVGAMLIFFIILAIAYIPRNQPPVNQAIVDMRTAMRTEVEAASRRQLREAALIDAEAGVYKIPLDRAIDLTLAKLGEN